MRELVPIVEKQLAALGVPLGLQLPNGERIQSADAPSVWLQFNTWAALGKLAAKQIGAIAEAYVEGTVEIKGSMRDVIAVTRHLVPGNPYETAHQGWWSRLFKQVKSINAQARHSKESDAQQIQFHYDVSDDFYALWLDPHRAYSCAYYQRPDMNLKAAQEAKFDHICRKLQLQAGERLLDIGSGWGGLMLWAAKHYGVNATGITLSKNQHAYTQALLEQHNLQDQVHVYLLDYRDLRPERPFDKISSVGMFEHVGRINLPDYFAQLHRLLKPGGLALNHGITAGHTDYHQLGAGMGDFIEKYIFPGGELVHIAPVLEQVANAGLEMVDTENLRPHYARTLWAWSDALESKLQAAHDILKRTLGDSTRADRVLRAYRLYLAGCAMSFEQGWIALHQVLATRPDGQLANGPLQGAQSSYPFNREYMYAQQP